MILLDISDNSLNNKLEILFVRFKKELLELSFVILLCC